MFFIPKGMLSIFLLKILMGCKYDEIVDFTYIIWLN